jgi:hypothetical protein
LISGSSRFNPSPDQAMKHIQALLPGHKGDKDNIKKIEQYPRRVRTFIQNIDGRNSDILIGDGDLLDKLFGLVQNIRAENENLRFSYLAEQAAHNETRKQRDAASILVHEKTREIANLHDRIKEKDVQHSTKLIDTKTEHETLVQNLMERYESTVNRMRHDHTVETDRLKSQLLNLGDSKPWPDDKLKIKFSELHVKVDNIAAPGKMGTILPEGYRSLEDLDLDPTGFLRRVGGSTGHILIKSTIWGVLYDHFFSLPFGFGILGPADDQNALLKAYASWYAVVKGRDTPSELAS